MCAERYEITIKSWSSHSVSDLIGYDDRGEHRDSGRLAQAIPVAQSQIV